MTESENKSKLDGILPFLLSLSAFILLLCFPKTVSAGVRTGMELCYRAIIPSVFPFMVLSELLRGANLAAIDKTVGRFLGAIYRVSPVGGRTVLLGILCGFPIGAKITSELYAAGAIKKNEAQRLLFFSACPSPAFVISGIGLSMMGDALLGIRLYLLVLVSMLAIGLLFPVEKEKKMPVTVSANQAQTSVVSAVQNAALGTLTVTAFITFFSILSALASSIIRSPIPSALLASVLEIGSGACAAVSLMDCYPSLSMAILGFSVAFSGISVYLQALAYIRQTSLSSAVYIKGKIASSILTAVLAYLFLC